jgi:hypothetical protein
MLRSARDRVRQVRPLFQELCVSDLGSDRILFHVRRAWPLRAYEETPVYCHETWGFDDVRKHCEASPCISVACS